MNQDKRHQGTEFDKHQDQAGKQRQGERAPDQGRQQSGQQPQPGQHPGEQQGGQRDRDEKSGGQGGQRR